MRTLFVRSLPTRAPMAMMLALMGALSGCSSNRVKTGDPAATREATPTDSDAHLHDFLEELVTAKESAEAFLSEMRPVAGIPLQDVPREATGRPAVRIAVSPDAISIDNVTRVEEALEKISAANLERPALDSLLKSSEISWARVVRRPESGLLMTLFSALLEVHDAERLFRFLETGADPGMDILLAEVHITRDVPCSKVMAILDTLVQAQFAVLEGAEDESSFDCQPGMEDEAEAAPSDPMPSLAVGSVQTRVEGDLSIAAVQEVLEARRAQIVDCYRDAYRRRPGIRGRLEMTWRIDVDGTASDAGVASTTIDDPALHDCIAKVIETWRFPPSAAGAAVVQQSWSLIPD